MHASAEGLKPDSKVQKLLDEGEVGRQRASVWGHLLGGNNKANLS